MPNARRPSKPARELVRLVALEQRLAALEARLTKLELFPPVPGPSIPLDNPWRGCHICGRGSDDGKLVDWYVCQDPRCPGKVSYGDPPLVPGYQPPYVGDPLHSGPGTTSPMIGTIIPSATCGEPGHTCTCR